MRIVSPPQVTTPKNAPWGTHIPHTFPKIRAGGRPRAHGVGDAGRYGIAIQEDGTTLLLWHLLGLIVFVGPFIAWHILFSNGNRFATAYNSANGLYYSKG